MRTYRCLLIADFNIENLASYLNHGKTVPVIEATVAPYGPVVQSLMSGNFSEGRNDKNLDFISVWTQPQCVSPSFARALNFESVSYEQILKEVDDFCSLIIQRGKYEEYILIASWVIPTNVRGYGLLDLRDGLGLANILNKMNLRMVENLKEQKNIFILNAQKWVESSGNKAFNPKMWYMAKIAFGNEVFRRAANDIENFCRAVAGQYKKLVIVDLDDTLWGGVLADESLKNIRLGGHDPIGEAFVDFQKTLKALTNKGVLLGIVSKNDEKFVLEAINQHPEMVLKQKDFAAWRINWKDKAQNIVDLVSELNLGLQSVVFIDDNPAERARVREALPEVYVPEWPQDKMLYASTLCELPCFDTAFISQEDLSRSAMYVSEQERKELKSTFSSYEDWLKTLEVNVRVERMDSNNIQRMAQLLNKTNQMNLTTRRLSEEELRKWAEQENNSLWAVRVSDKFGDSGLTGIMSLCVENKKGKIIDFVLSCRVMGRKIEETMVHVLCSYALELNLKEIYAEFIPTQRNKPCFDFWRNSGFSFNQPINQFSWNLEKEYNLPHFIKLERPLLCYES